MVSQQPANGRVFSRAPSDFFPPYCRPSSMLYSKVLHKTRLKQITKWTVGMMTTKTSEAKVHQWNKLVSEAIKRNSTHNTRVRQWKVDLSCVDIIYWSSSLRGTQDQRVIPHSGVAKDTPKINLIWTPAFNQLLLEWSWSIILPC